MSVQSWIIKQQAAPRSMALRQGIARLDQLGIDRIPFPDIGVDPIQIREIRSLIKTLGAERSVIISSHILTEVQATCDRVLIIREGKLIYNASIETLKNHSKELSITVALKQPPGIEQLMDIDQVELVEAIDNNRFRLYFNGSSPAESVVMASVEQQWGLYELVPDRASLEDLFIELTRDSSAGVGNQES